MSGDTPYRCILIAGLSTVTEWNHVNTTHSKAPQTIGELCRPIVKLGYQKFCSSHSRNVPVASERVEARKRIQQSNQTPGS